MGQNAHRNVIKTPAITAEKVLEECNNTTLSKVITFLFF